MIFERIKSLLLQLGYIAERLADPLRTEVTKCVKIILYYTLMNLAGGSKMLTTKAMDYVRDDGIFINQEIAHQNMCVVLV